MAQVSSKMLLLGGLLAVMACGSKASPSLMLPLDPEVTLSRFMSAVQANDLASMSQLWGTKDGLAARKMERAELNQRLTVMRIMLKHERYEITADLLTAGLDDKTRLYHVRLTRMGCQVDVPFELIRLGEGWLVSVIDLTQAGNPARTCR
ncbi:MAG: hypothetical protein ACE10G_00320 [Gemmatimonadales bacterium]